jgi:hypothetical protein
MKETDVAGDRSALSQARDALLVQGAEGCE